jgi:hypothetical protein
MISPETPAGCSPIPRPREVERPGCDAHCRKRNRCPRTCQTRDKKKITKRVRKYRPGNYREEDGESVKQKQGGGFFQTAGRRS